MRREQENHQQRGKLLRFLLGKQEIICLLCYEIYRDNLLSSCDNIKNRYDQKVDQMIKVTKFDKKIYLHF